MKKLLAIALFATLFSGVKEGYAGDILIGSFQGLNTQDNPVALEDNEAQDLLNVGITPGGRSVYKREGYGLHKTLSLSTSAVHGVHYFQDTSGSDIQLYGHDAFLAATVNGIAPVDVATGTVAATWQCTDNLGFAYCVTSSRNTPVRTSGTTGSTTYHPTIPLGTMITNTPDRLVVAGVSGAGSSLYFSQVNTFTNFTVGINSADPFVEVINAPGSRLTHIRYACGKLLWWKDGSFGYTLGSDQFNLENITVSQNIGTLDNSSDEYNGIVYFRGQDNHIYQYDCANVTRLSRKITPTVAASGRRRSNSWEQSSQTDFAAGSVNLNGPSLALSTAIVSGDVRPSSITIVDTSTSDFSQGSGPAIDTTTVSGAVTLKTYFQDGFSSFSNWTTDSGLTCTNTMTASGGAATCTGSACCLGVSSQTINADFILQLKATAGSSAGNINLYALNSSNAGYQFRFFGNSGGFQNVDISSVTNLFAGFTTLMSSRAITSSVVSTFTVTRDSTTGLFTLYMNGVSTLTATNTATTSFSAIRVSNSDNVWSFDNVYDVARVGNFTGRVFDTAFSTPVYGTFTAGSTSTGTYSYAYRCSSNSANAYTTDTAITSGSAITGCELKRYLVYSATMTAPGSSATILPQLTDATAIAASTGTYSSAVNNAPSLASWSTFSVDDSVVVGTITYYVRASTAQFIVNSSTPAWALQLPNATVNYATGTYMQMKADFSVSIATNPPSISAFTFNWFEGASSDKAYIKYWNDYVWVAVSSGTSGLNNRIQRWDILNQTWLYDDIPSNGFLVDNNFLYFGSPSEGKIFKYGNGVTTDNSGNINSYWKSKNFTGQDPFVQNGWDQSDFVVKSASPTIMSVTYQLDGSTSTTYSMNLYHATKTILHKGVNLPSKNGTFYNVKFGDNSSDPRWEVFGYRVRYTPMGWRPE